MALTMPTRELVGLLNDVRTFASPDDEDPTWHRVMLHWDGARLHAYAGDGLRLAWMSWGPADGDQPELPGMEFGAATDDAWELAITPADAKEIATKFKLTAKEGAAPVRVTGNADTLRVERDAETGTGVALTSVALSRPWSDSAPDVVDTIVEIAETASGYTRESVGYQGAFLANFCNPKVVRQRGVFELHFGRTSTYIKIGDWFRGAVIQAPQDEMSRQR